MRNSRVIILKGDEVHSLLNGRESELLEIVERAYQVHRKGDSSLPHSVFLKFPQEERNRIIALPAYLGEGFDVAGVKWIASFPGNCELGLDRASAVMILNSVRTGAPEAILEGSVISAKRTAASAALAARWLHSRPVTTVGLIGCGLINFEIARFLLKVHPEITRFLLFDLLPERARLFQEKCDSFFPNVQASVAKNIEIALQSASLISFATTAIRPYVSDLSLCVPGSTILHVSLRDLAPEVILSCDNVVDDIDHVTRAQTSIHLTEQLCGNRDFIRCVLGDILNGAALPRKDNSTITVFSPFGLGVLDVAVGQLTYTWAIREKVGAVIDSFLPSS